MAEIGVVTLPFNLGLSLYPIADNQSIIALIAVENIIAGRPYKGIIALTAKEQIIPFAAIQVVVASTAIENIIASASQQSIIAFTASQIVITSAANNQIITSTAIQNTAYITANNNIIASPSINLSCLVPNSNIIVPIRAKNCCLWQSKRGTRPHLTRIQISAVQGTASTYNARILKAYSCTRPQGNRLVRLMTVKTGSPDTPQTNFVQTIRSYQMLGVSPIQRSIFQILQILSSCQQIRNNHINTYMAILIWICIVVYGTNRVPNSNHISNKAEILSLEGIHNSLSLSSLCFTAPLAQSNHLSSRQMNLLACQKLFLSVELQLSQHTRASLCQSRQSNTGINIIHTCHHLSQTTAQRMTSYRNAIALSAIGIYCICHQILKLLIALTHLRRNYSQTNLQICQAILTNPQRTQITIRLSTLQGNYQLLFPFVYKDTAVKSVAGFHLSVLSPFVLHGLIRNQTPLVNQPGHISNRSTSRKFALNNSPISLADSII